MADAQVDTQLSGEDDRFEAIATELYGLRPEDFAAARDAAVRQARSTKGGRALAQRLAALRRPVQSAWYLNLLSHHRPDDVAAFLALGEALQQAQAGGDVPALQRLMGQRRTQEDALARTARTLAADAGSSITAAQERELRETLGAALALPDLAAELRIGRLLKPVSYAGFGPLVAVPAIPPVVRRSGTVPVKQPTTVTEPGAIPPPAIDTAGQAHARQVEAARTAVDEAARALQVAGAAREADEQRANKHREDVARLEALMREARPQLAAAEAASVKTQQEYDRAVQAHQRAVERLERMERESPQR